MDMIEQTFTSDHFAGKPDKAALVKEFAGKSIDGLRTPAMIINRSIFATNCAKMHLKAREWGASFRAHLKTHKTAEGTRLQLSSSADKTHAVVVSTLMEAWELVRAGLVSDMTVQDILYGVPLPVNKIADLSLLWEKVAPHGGIVRLLIDHPDQVKCLEMFEKTQKREQLRRWSIFVKINGGQNRAGLHPESSDFADLLSALINSPVISIHGFYGHAGNSYASKSLSEASDFLSGEVDVVNTAAGIALLKLSKATIQSAHTQPFVLSVGSTPTAHAASAETKQMLRQVLHGNLELHAGNYPMLDLQQQHTGMIEYNRISQRVRATVVSYYPGRGVEGSDEALIDAGAIAFSKDSGPSGTYGEVIGTPWVVGRISQEHGILTCTSKVMKETDKLKLGTVVDVIGQHACLIAAAYPWYYVVDTNANKGSEVVDIWVPWKGW